MASEIDKHPDHAAEVTEEMEEMIHIWHRAHKNIDEPGTVEKCLIDLVAGLPTPHS